MASWQESKSNLIVKIVFIFTVGFRIIVFILTVGSAESAEVEAAASTEAEAGVAWMEEVLLSL